MKLIHNTVIVSLLAVSTLTQADSAQITWKQNGHSYQLFENKVVSWEQAKVHCEKINAHLATITDKKEQTFIANKLLKGRSTRFLLGGSRNNPTSEWQWITGEKWNYSHWDKKNNEPNNHNEAGYTAIYGSLTDSSYLWSNITSSTYTLGYICEWSSNTYNYIDSSTLPDINNNGFAEIAALYIIPKTSQHMVIIKDSNTKKILSKLTFSKNHIHPHGMVVVNDINGNNIPEIGVLSTESGWPTVQIKDALNNKKTLRTIKFLSRGYRAQSISANLDLNGNGASEITVLGLHKQTGKAVTQTRDSKNLNSPILKLNF